MAQISYEDFTAFVESNTSNQYDVGFFSLKDGEEALVRILCDSLADLDIQTTHAVTVGNSSFPNRQVACLRDPREPLDKCPFCAADVKVKQRVFIKMVQYDPNTRQASCVIWDRAASQLVPKLKTYINNYGPLSQIMCKIVRTGSGLDTVYDIIPALNPQVYTMVDYPIPADAFKDYKVLGRVVMDKSADEMNQYLATGVFPEKPKENAPASPIAEPVPYQVAPQQAPPMMNTGVAQPGFGAAPVIDRPVRTY